MKNVWPPEGDFLYRDPLMAIMIRAPGPSGGFVWTAKQEVGSYSIPREPFPWNAVLGCSSNAYRCKRANAKIWCLVEPPLDPLRCHDLQRLRVSWRPQFFLLDRRVKTWCLRTYFGKKNRHYSALFRQKNDSLNWAISWKILTYIFT